MMSNNVYLDVPLTSASLFYEPAREEAQEYNWWEYDVGVFKAYAVSYTSIIHWPFHRLTSRKGVYLCRYFLSLMRTPILLLFAHA